MGMSRLHVAGLLVTSVSRATRMRMTNSMNQRGRASKKPRLVPIHLDKPDAYNRTRRGSEFVPKYDNIQVLLLLALQSISVYYCTY